MRAPMPIAVLLFYIFAISGVVHAEQARAVPQVGILLPVQRADYDETKDPLKAAFMDGLQAFGYIDGKNIHVEVRAPSKPEDLAEMAADLVNRKVDVIATTGPQPIEAAGRATATIPIVIIACDRADRLVASIARPGGNITGMSCISSDLASKRLQLLQEVVPAFSRVSVLFNVE
jgi:putative tryptophan/tyrosine transport system substrate-binding protein